MLKIIEQFKKIRISKKNIADFIGKSHILFLMISIPAIVLFVVLVPSGFGPDEEVHTARAYQISTGNLYPDSLGQAGRFGGKVPVSLINLFKYGSYESNSMNKSAQFYDRKDIGTPATYNSLRSVKFDAQNTAVWAFGSTGPYAPIVYAPAAMGMYIGRHLNMSVGNVVVLSRLMQASMYVLLCALALWIVRDSKVKWLLFLIVLLPMSIFQASIITADTYTTAVVVLFTAIILKLLLQKSLITNRQTVSIIVATILLALTKPSYAIFGLMILALPLPLFKTRKRQILVISTLLMLLAILFFAVSWKGLYYTSSISLMVTAPADSGVASQIHWIAGHLLEFTKTIYHTLIIYPEVWAQDIVGRLGYDMVPTPYVLVSIAWSLLLIAGLYAKEFTLKISALLLIVGVASAFSVIFLLYASFNVIGANLVAGVQGRYFIPCVSFIALGVTRFIPVTVDIPKRYATLFFGSASAIILYSTVYVYLRALY